MERVKTALVGCGKVGQIHAQALATLAESELVGVCDVDADRASAFAARFGGRPYHRRRHHAARARRAGRRDRDAAPARTPPRRSWRRRPACTCWSRSRWPRAWPTATPCSPRRGGTGSSWGSSASADGTSRSSRMKAAIDAGKIGRPVLGMFVMYSWRDPSYYRSDPWRGRWDTEGGGVLVNQSPHMLDLLTWLMDDEVAEVERLLGQPQSSRPSRSRTRPWRSSASAAAASARSSPAWRRGRASTPRCISTGRTARPSASRPTAARRSSPASRGSPSRRSTTSGPSRARRTASPRSRPRTGRGSRASTP